MPKTKTLRLLHASGNTFMSIAKEAQDVRALLPEDADIITITEAAEQATFDAIRRAAGPSYEAVNPDAGDIAFLVHKDHRILRVGGPLAIPGKPGPASEGGHGPRHNSFVAIDFQGEHLTHTGVHFVTRQPGNRVFEQVKQATMMGNQMRAFGKGRMLATGSGDLNAHLPQDPALSQVFKEFGLTTTAQETHNTEPTHGGTRLDYIWTYDEDHRLSVESMDVLPDHRFHSDHDPVLAVLRIKP